MKIKLLNILFVSLGMIGFYAFNFGQVPNIYFATELISRKITFSPDENYFISQTDLGITLWDVEKERDLRLFETDCNYKENSISQILAISFDNQKIAYVCGTEIKLLDMITGKKLLTLTGHSKPIKSIAFDPTNNFLASSSDDKSLKLWNLTNGKIENQLDNSVLISSLLFKTDGRKIAGIIENGKIKVWDIYNLQNQEVYDYENKKIQLLKFDSDLLIWGLESENKLSNAFFFSEYFIWSVFKNTKLKSLGPIPFFSPPGNSADAILLPKKTTFVFNSSNIYFWNASEVVKRVANPKYSFGGIYNKDEFNQRLFKIIYSSVSAPNKFSFGSQGENLALLNCNEINFFSLTKGSFLNKVNLLDLTNNPSGCGTFMIMSPDGKKLILRMPDTSYDMRILEASTGRLLGHQWQWFALPDKEISFSPDNKYFAASHYHPIFFTNIAIVDLSTGENISIIKTNHQEDINSLSYSHSGKWLASGGFDKTVKIWNVKNGEEIKTGEFTATIQTITFNPTDDIIAVGYETFVPGEGPLPNYENGIILWNIKNNSQEKIVGNLPNVVNALEFSPDGDLLAALYTDEIHFWNVETKTEVKLKEIPSWVAKNRHFGLINYNEHIFKPIIKNEKFTFLDVSTNKEIVSISFVNGDWLITTPDGFFDGIPQSWKHLIWRFNNNTFDYVPVETYFNDFFYPNLLQDVLNGKSPKAPAGSELEKKDRRQPKVEIASINDQSKEQINAQNLTDKRTATVAVEVSDNNSEKKQTNHNPTSGAQDLRLFRNGSLVKVWHEDVFKLGKADGCEQINKQGEPNRVRCQAEVPIVAGDNNFTAYAFNSDNVKSNDDSVSVKGADSLKQDGTLYILAVGVNKYANSAYNLNFAVPDVEEIGAAIKQQQDKLAQDAMLKQYARTEIITLTDEGATKENILLALRRFSEGDKTAIPNNASETLKSELAKIKPTQPEDALIIYYAGHGTSNGQRFYLLPHNFTGANGVKSLDEQGISDIELNEALEKVDAGRLLMAIDACQSGQALGEQNEGRGPMNSKGLAQLAYDKGMLILTAAQSQQSALEAVRIGDKEIKHGLLTYALLQGLSDSQADKDGNRQLWEREWLDYAVERVPQLQLEAMKQRRIEIEKNGRGAEIVFVNGDNKNANPADRKVQTPRVFYRREAEINPMIIAKP